MRFVGSDRVDGASCYPGLCVARSPVITLLGKLCSHVELIKTPLPKSEPDAFRREMRREFAEELLPDGPDRDAAGI